MCEHKYECIQLLLLKTLFTLVTQIMQKMSWSKFNRNLKGVCFSAVSEPGNHRTLGEVLSRDHVVLSRDLEVLSIVLTGF